MKTFDDSQEALTELWKKHSARAINFAGYALWSLFLAILLGWACLLLGVGRWLARCQYRITQPHFIAVRRPRLMRVDSEAAR